MGDPKKHRKKYTTPPHPWQKDRIMLEKDLKQKYGLRRKYEIWKMNTILKGFTSQAKNLIASSGPQADKERKQLLAKLSKLGLLGKEAKIEDVLALSLSDVMERRLQTLVFRRELSRSLDQARQFIVHEHISIGEKTIKAPSYLVPLSEENNIQFVAASVFTDESHPERIKEEKKEDKKKSKSKESKEKKEEKSEEKKEAPVKEEKKSESKEAKAEEKKEKPEAKEEKNPEAEEKPKEAKE